MFALLLIIEMFSIRLSEAKENRKNSNCLRVTCASMLFRSGADDKLIRERTCHHVSNALFKYGKAERIKLNMFLTF